MILISKVCCCCYKNDQIKSEPPVEEIHSHKNVKFNGNKSQDIFQQNKTIVNNKEITDNSPNTNVVNNSTEISTLSIDNLKNQKNNGNLMKNSETAAITNMMLDDINEDDLEITPIIHSESEIKVDLNAIEEASLEDIYELSLKEKDNNDKTNNSDETSSRVIKMLNDDSKLDLTSQSIDSDEVDDDGEEEGIEVNIRETISATKGSGIITYEDSLVSQTNTSKPTAMYGNSDDDSDSDSDDSDDSDDDTTDDDSETTDDAKENTITMSLSKIEEKKNITVKRDGSTITAVPAIVHSEHTDDEMSEKVI